MSRTVLLSSAAESVQFGRGGFILHSLDYGTPHLKNGSADGRTVVITGYILSDGNTPEAREQQRDQQIRRLFRIVSAADGFTLSDCGKTLRLLCAEAPALSSDPPFTGSDTAFFTIRAQAAESSFFTSNPIEEIRHSESGKLIFPLTISETTVFAQSSPSGAITLRNPGDAPCGFCCEITVTAGSVTSVQIGSAGCSLAVTHDLTAGESIKIDTRPGHKGVTKAGESILSDTAWDSEFFPLLPGVNELAFVSTGGGSLQMRFTFIPLYL